ncbi:MAG: nucleotidyl transferase AbiEii/AbiGii toxin family protein, partial [Myxococcota bacterium]
MNVVAILSASDRFDLFTTAAAQRGDMTAAVVEKDFWVCWTLKQLFTMDNYRDHLLFKGGTSLSKVFGLIQRFSEDIDLAVDWELLGYVGDKSPLADLSKTKRAKLLDAMLKDCRAFIGGEFVAALRARFAAVLGSEAGWSLEQDPNALDTLIFEYPRTEVEPLDYIQPAVVLELGTHAEFIPNDRYKVQPYAAETFPQAFNQPGCSVTAIKAERTFLEKLTILHAEHHRPPDRPFPQRYSRHYYDLAVMADSEAGEAAVKDAG